GWKTEDLKAFRNTYVKCILATDLASSFEYISKFKGFTTATASHGSGAACQIDGSHHHHPIILLQMILKVADVAHPCKPWHIHRRWSDLVTEEFFSQVFL
ncbi:unnamed protein product, partial [Choristocarpus tenellus]